MFHHKGAGYILFSLSCSFLKPYGYILVKRFCDLEQQVKGEVLRSFFSAAYVGMLSSDALCKLLLRQSFFQSCLHHLLQNFWSTKKAADS